VPIALLVITDGRGDYLERTVASAEEMLVGPIAERWMYDDSDDDEHREWLRGRFPQFRHFDAGPRQGFGGAIRAAWARLLAESDARFVFHLEADFTFNLPVDLTWMRDTLEDRPYLAQLALLRQPWNPAERAAGGIVQMHPDDYTQVVGSRGAAWLEHRRHFTTNPCMYRRALMETGWPAGGESEGRFGLGLFALGFDGVAGADVRCGYWGTWNSPPWVHHIGDERAGCGY